MGGARTPRHLQPMRSSSRITFLAAFLTATVKTLVKQIAGAGSVAIHNAIGADLQLHQGDNSVLKAQHQARLVNIQRQAAPNGLPSSVQDLSCKYTYFLPSHANKNSNMGLLPMRNHFCRCVSNTEVSCRRKQHTSQIFRQRTSWEGQILCFSVVTKPRRPPLSLLNAT